MRFCVFILEGVQSFVILVTTMTINKTSGRPHRFEPLDTQWDVEHPKCAELLRNAGWFVFFEKITWVNVEVSTEFARKFTGMSI